MPENGPGNIPAKGSAGGTPPPARDKTLSLVVALVMLVVGALFYAVVLADFTDSEIISANNARSFAPTASVLGLACIVIALTAVVAVAIGLDVRIDWKQKSVGESSVQAAGAAAILLVIFGGLYFLAMRDAGKLRLRRRMHLLRKHALTLLFVAAPNFGILTM